MVEQRTTTRRDTALFYIPLTVIGVHAVTEVAAVLLLLVAGLCYLRLRPGLRAAAALGLGAIALASGIGAHAWFVAAAGLALLVLGAEILWRTRRSDGHLWLRRAFLVLVAAATTLFVIVPMTAAVIATHKPRAEVKAADLGRPYERVSFRTLDGLTLHGWYVPSMNRAAVIAFPGRSGPVRHARMLASYGYGVLLFDPRGQGESGGEPNSYGWGGTPDLVAAVAWLKARPDVDPHRIGGLGLSVGGELMIEAAASTPGLRAVVSDGAGMRSLNDHMSNDDIPAAIRWMTPLVAQTATLMALTGESPPDDLAELVAKIAPRPLLLIEAENGAGGEEMNERYFEAADPPKQRWVVEGAGHTGGIRTAPAEYERRVIGFLDRALRAG